MFSYTTEWYISLRQTLSMISPSRRIQLMSWHSYEQRILPAESAKPGILGMVDTLYQWLHEQRDTRFGLIRSAKPSINVLLAHWHHVWTTDTVIISSYKISLRPLRQCRLSYPKGNPRSHDRGATHLLIVNSHTTSFTRAVSTAWAHHSFLNRSHIQTC